MGVTLRVVAEQLGHMLTPKMVERYHGHLKSGHIAQTFRALPGVGLDKAAKDKGNILIPMPVKRTLNQRAMVKRTAGNSTGQEKAG